MVTATAVCSHHWVVASLPVDGVYPARCRDCGQPKDFPFIGVEDWVSNTQSFKSIKPAVVQTHPALAPCPPPPAQGRRLLEPTLLAVLTDTWVGPMDISLHIQAAYNSCSWYLMRLCERGLAERRREGLRSFYRKPQN